MVEGAAVSAFEPSADDSGVRIAFDNAAVLTIVPGLDEDWDLAAWELFTPDHFVVVRGPGLVWETLRSDRRPDFTDAVRDAHALVDRDAGRPRPVGRLASAWGRDCGGVARRRPERGGVLQRRFRPAGKGRSAVPHHRPIVCGGPAKHSAALRPLERSRTGRMLRRGLRSRGSGRGNPRAAFEFPPRSDGCRGANDLTSTIQRQDRGIALPAALAGFDGHASSSLTTPAGSTPIRRWSNP